MNTNNPHLSVVTPVYGCGDCIMQLYNRLSETLESISWQYEIIMVEDSSPDQSWSVIQQLAARDKRVKGIKFAKNFGQHTAITAGLDEALGDWVVVMDCDLQDQPEEIPKLYAKAREGYDVVFARRRDREDTLLKRWESKLFYKVYDYFTESTSDPAIANFSISSRKVIENYRHLREQNRNFPLFIQWMGFETAAVDVEHQQRMSGTSSYNLSKLMNLAVDGIVSQSNKPLRLSIKFGFLLSTGAVLYGLYLMYQYFFMFEPVPGWTSIMVSIYFVGGLLFANLGILGLYMGKVFNEVKNRPLYIVQESVGFNEKNVEKTVPIPASKQK
ncbi:glycosyltransferase family 2 protein [Salibacterium halotolerans]|uniref:Dolichol-phosphate mannosyltransferase n=1 Tax=Salibacterium halotolerans TaxID=1884432 RepID=A0A1I5WQM0_9BACI|nr:glycosyltransferase family 2 protein [Salibacterium halotolerans]SFQ22095.1 dolichol-phosphate mannosyltransferase [Salibacterium halotolerans]